MTGLLVLGLFGLWLWAVLKLGSWLGQQVLRGRWRWLITALVVVAVLPLPVIDELAARSQIEALCKANAVLKIDEQRIKGRRVRYVADPHDAPVPGLPIPGRFTRDQLRDEASGELLATGGWYVFEGGVVVRTLGFSNSASPMFARSSCAAPEGLHQAAERLGFRIIN